MVPGPIRSADRRSHTVAQRSNNAEATAQPSLPFEPRDTAPTRLEAILEPLVTAGFSEEVTSRVADPLRAGTSALYNYKGHNSLLGVLEGRQIRSRPLIARVLIRYGKNVSSDPNLSALVRSLNISRPSVQRPQPKWDLSVVRNVLSRPPFEPMVTAAFKLVS